MFAHFWGVLGGALPGSGSAWCPSELGFEAQRRADAFGLRIHTACALITLLCLAGPTTMTELAPIPVVLAFLIRLGRHKHLLGPLVIHPLGLVLGLWTLWAVLGLAWSPDPGQGLAELGNLRWGLLVMALWPVMERRAWLLAALIAGLHLGQITQAMHAVGVVMDWPSLRWNRMPGRWSGWWDPVVGGTLLTALVGLHLPAAAWGRGWWRLAGLAGTACSIAGVVATGTRGAWLATLGLIGLVVIGAWWRSAHRVRTAGILLALVVLAGGSVLLAGGALSGGGLGQRIEAGVVEVRRAIAERDYASDTGARIGMAIWAMQAWATHPVQGVGTGGYKAWTWEHLEEQGVPEEQRRVHAHAHNTLLHIGATGGLIGAGIVVLWGLSTVSSAGRWVVGDGPGGYRDGPLFALLGLALVSVFDVVHLNAQTGALLAALIALRLPNRPRWKEGEQDA